MTVTDEKKTAPSGTVPTGSGVARELAASGALDDLFEQVESGKVELTGSAGLLPALLKEALERGLQAELTDHLGYEKGEPAKAARGNARGGTTTKMIDSEVGSFEIEVPRDRAGSFTPRLVRKGQRRMDGLDSMIVSLYAGGMTVREIRHHLETTLGVELSAGTISKVTDAVCDAVMEWQNRPLEEFYPVIYLDAIRIKVRADHRVTTRSAHIAVGVDMDGIKHVLGIWVQAEEGASFWAHVCAQLANRGIKDVLIVCCDGLVGLPEAIEATWPDSLVQTCVVHLIRASMRFVAYGDRKQVAKALKPVYTAPNEEAALQALADFSDQWGSKYPEAVATWERAWERFTPFLAFPPMLRRVIYTTNSIESLNYQLRKVSKNRGQFPSDEAAVKLLWLAICNIEDKRARERDKEKNLPASKRKAKGRMVEGQVTTNWKQALAQLTAAYPERIRPYL
ncbi:IS256 family transposase [Actinomyces qiguomingii]|uniref:IS256 family transposase n=1 Tax=Actinomyces qiguomingii TaxID=2057800 RepID=UPI000FFE4D16|nr:IS256 family transposase [Actinomyces qiguomingii]